MYAGNNIIQRFDLILRDTTELFDYSSNQSSHLKDRFDTIYEHQKKQNMSTW
jgi:hypothetical protein